MARPKELTGGPERATRLAMKLAGTIHRRLYAATRGRLGRSVQGMPVLLLTTVGRKTGQPRTWPLGYLEDGDTLVVIASAGGVSTHPAWYLNLRDRPAVTVQIGERSQRMVAATAGPAERSRLWARLIASYPFFADYQARAMREIPVVVLRPG